jgi:D-beta-D-heptose 7-phosphate kinase/D-beta-D-heptose 1-phosphate adenosyltransferase
MTSSGPADDLAALLQRIAGSRMLCVGDAMLDRSVIGRVERISPEAPVPVLTVTAERERPGGAANVALNAVALGASMALVAVIGDDPAGLKLSTLIGAEPGIDAALIAETGRPTTVKTRCIAQGQQMLRLDRETVEPPSAASRAALLQQATGRLAGSGALVLSDYGKGMLADGVAETLIAAAKAQTVPVLVDPRGPAWGRYRGAALVTPNRRELAEAAGAPTPTPVAVIEAARRLIAAHDLGAVLVTLSEDGVLLIRSESEPLHFPAAAREVYDVTGAGDTVIAALAAAIAAGIGLEAAADLANRAAAVVVGRVGTAVARPAEILGLADGNDMPLAAAGKVVRLDQALARIEEWRGRGLAIGFTNGCFDLLHAGHVALLAAARHACGRLVVAINDDAAVARLKGSGRPIHRVERRAAVLAALAAVDLVIVFAEDTPLRLVEAIRPQILIKGADWRRDQVVGAELVERHGGRVLLVPLIGGEGTTATIARLRERPRSATARDRSSVAADRSP